jgi:hypothetical protein
VQLTVSTAKWRDFRVTLKGDAFESLGTLYDALRTASPVFRDVPFLIYSMAPHVMHVMQDTLSMKIILQEAMDGDGCLMAVQVNSETHKRLVKQVSGYKVEEELAVALLSWFSDAPLDPGVDDEDEAMGPAELLREKHRATAI